MKPQDRNLQDLLERLRHPDGNQRLRAVREVLTHISPAHWEAWQRIEWLALYDEDPLVRQVALAALLTPQGQQYYEQWISSLTWSGHQARMQELQHLAENGVVDPATAAVILDLFRKYTPRPPEEAETAAEATPEAPAPEATAAETVRPEEALAETRKEAPQPRERPTTRPEPVPSPPPVASRPAPPTAPRAARPARPRTEREEAAPLLYYVLVYVGAFLVAAASLLLAGIPELRVLALLGGTGLFFLLALVLWWVFRPGAAVFYGLATFYLWADAYVILQDIWRPGQDLHRFLFLFGVALVVGTLWAIGTWAFRSRFFAVLTAMAFPLGAFWLALALTPRGVTRVAWSHAFVQAALVVQWGWTLVLRRVEGKLAWPARLVSGMFNSAHALGLAASMLALFGDGHLDDPRVQIPLTLAWVLMLAAFATFLHGWRIPVWDEIGLGWSLFWLPLVWILPYERPEPWFAAMTGMAYMALALPFLWLLKGKRRPKWGWGWYLAFTGNGAVLLFLAVVGGSARGWAPLLWSALGGALALVHLLLGRWAGTWFLFLFWFTVTYFRFWAWLDLPDTHPIHLYAPALLTWLLGAALPWWKRRGKRSWMLATLPLALFAAFIGFVLPLTDDVLPAWWRSGSLLLTGLAFLYWAVLGEMPFWVVFTVLYTYVAHGLLLEGTFLEDFWPATFVGYPVLYLVVEQVLATRNKGRLRGWIWALRFLSWATIFAFTPALLTVDHFSAPLTLFLWTLIVAAYVVTLASPWPALPAALLFLMSAGKTLDILNAPHLILWMSTLVGLLALALYLLFMRFQRHGFARAWALLGQMGMYFLSYVAWLDREMPFGYFTALFLQALAALALGAFLKEGAWLWPAIVALVVTVATAVIAQLGGTGVLLVVCGTGFVLLLAGLFFLYRRTRRTIRR